MTDREQEARFVIHANSNVSRGKFAAAAVHAALTAAGAHPGLPVIVLGAKPRDIENLTTVIYDAGKTEVEPGTVTAGTDWRPAHLPTEPDEDKREALARTMHADDMEHGRAFDSFEGMDPETREWYLDNSAAILARFHVTPHGAEPDGDNWEYAAGYEGRGDFEGRWYALGDHWFSLREAAENEMTRYTDPQITLIRRRKPGTAEPVTPRGEGQ